LRIDQASIAGMKVTVMGLGLNGGGLPTALYFARRGAAVTVTDLRDAATLKESMDRLADQPVRYVLGRHVEEDFAGADLVIKNPAVSPSSPFLRAAREKGVPVETDLSIFLSVAKNPLIAVTGSKGKSTTASAIAFAITKVFRGAKLGGNITVSPLSFLEELSPEAPVVLELSSWQLGDLRGRGLLRPAVSVFTVILPDHLDKYAGMEDYIADKKVIFQEQEAGQVALFNADDPWQRDFPRETRARPLLYSAGPLPAGTAGAWLDGEAGFARIGGATPGRILGASRLEGRHNRMNLLCAGLALHAFGLKPEVIRKAMEEFPGIEHRLELARTWQRIRFYNDSAATIPHATAEALRALAGPVVLLTGGTDKNIDFAPLAEVARLPAAIVLLAGTGTEKMRAVLDAAGAGYDGPYSSLQEALACAVRRAAALAEGHPGGLTGVSLLFSPGCTSFGMFRNEFDRGRRFKEMVAALGSEPAREASGPPARPPAR
jgi:UDP-N-acetylmuramoylalanine--D-glutamate ligase